MTKTWVIADTHFGHSGVCRFTNSDGSKLRPWTDPDEMDEALIKNWNSLVSEKDRVYVLGDLAINRKAIKTVGLCAGRKILIKGNHDIFRLKDYVDYFDDVQASHSSPHSFIMTHIPIHPDSLGRWKINIHGHTHGHTLNDPRYVCVSVEQTDFKPVELTWLLNQHIKQGEDC